MADALMAADVRSPAQSQTAALGVENQLAAWVDKRALRDSTPRD